MGLTTSSFNISYEWYLYCRPFTNVKLLDEYSLQIWHVPTNNKPRIIDFPDQTIQEIVELE
jgi:hypothetical protein